VCRFLSCVANIHIIFWLFKSPRGCQEEARRKPCRGKPEGSQEGSQKEAGGSQEEASCGSQEEVRRTPGGGQEEGRRRPERGEKARIFFATSLIAPSFSMICLRSGAPALWIRKRHNLARSSQPAAGWSQLPVFGNPSNSILKLHAQLVEKLHPTRKELRVVVDQVLQRRIHLAHVVIGVRAIA
jgi:hypothetical protein